MVPPCIAEPYVSFQLYAPLGHALGHARIVACAACTPSASQQPSGAIIIPKRVSALTLLLTPPPRLIRLYNYCIGRTGYTNFTRLYGVYASRK